MIEGLLLSHDVVEAKSAFREHKPGCRMVGPIWSQLDMLEAQRLRVVLLIQR
jgi:hypothetical protein